MGRVRTRVERLEQLVPGSASNPLNNTGVAAGTYGDSTHVSQVTIGTDGRITGATNVAIAATGGGFYRYDVLTASGAEDQINLNVAPTANSLVIWINDQLYRGWSLASTTVTINPLTAGDKVAVYYAAASAPSASTLSTVNDPWFSYVSSRLTMDGVNNAQVFTDNTGKVWTARDQVKTVTGNKQFGTASLFNPTGASCITTPAHADFNFGAQDFTVEFWVYSNWSTATMNVAFANVLNSWAGGGTTPGGVDLSWMAYVNQVVGDGDSKLTFKVAVGSTNYKLQDSVGLATLAGVWTKYAFVRDAGTLRLYRGIAGTLTQVASTSIVGYINDNTTQQVVCAGASQGGSIVNNWEWQDNIDDVRITKGVCWYPNGTSVPVEVSALPTSGNGLPLPAANTYLPYTVVSTSITVGRNTANHITASSLTLTLPHTGLVTGDMVVFTRASGLTAPTVTSVAPTINTRAGNDTSISYDLTVPLKFAWNGTSWDLNL